MKSEIPPNVTARSRGTVPQRMAGSSLAMTLLGGGPPPPAPSREGRGRGWLHRALFSDYWLFGTLGNWGAFEAVAAFAAVAFAASAGLGADLLGDVFAGGLVDHAHR